MIDKTTNISYARSLLWLAFFIAVICGVTNIVELLIVDFIHGNPHRTQANAMLMMVLFTPIFGVIAVIASLIVFAIPQCFQAVLSGVLVQRFGRGAHFGVLLALPLTAALSWYCFDYTSPWDMNLGINVGPDWSMHRHGLTEQRYLIALEVQAPLTLFSILYCDASIRHSPKRSIILAALAMAIILGAILGHDLAKSQFQFL